MTMTRFANRLSDGVFPSPLAGLRLPDRRFVVGEYVLGGDEASSVRNHANPDLPLTVQGAPAYSAHSATVRSSLTVGYGFLTGIVPDQESTLIVVRKNATIASTVRIVAMDSSASSPFWGVAQVGGDNYGYTGDANQVSGAKRTRPVTADLYFEAVVGSVRDPQRAEGGYGRLYYYDSGQQVAVSASIAATPYRNYTPVCIGSNKLPDTITTNTLEVAFVAIVNRPMTAGEIDAAYQAIVAWYAGVGVTVV